MSFSLPGYDSPKQTPKSWSIANDCDCACDGVKQFESEIISHSASVRRSLVGFAPFDGSDGCYLVRETTVTRSGTSNTTIDYDDGSIETNDSMGGSYTIVEAYVNGVLTVISVSGAVSMDGYTTNTRPEGVSTSGASTRFPEISSDGRSWSLKTASTGDHTFSFPESGTSKEDAVIGALTKVGTVGYSGSSIIGPPTYPGADGTSEWDWSIVTTQTLSEEFKKEDVIDEVKGLMTRFDTESVRAHVEVEFKSNPYTEYYIDSQIEFCGYQIESAESEIEELNTSNELKEEELATKEAELITAKSSKETAEAALDAASIAYAKAGRSVRTWRRRLKQNPEDVSIADNLEIAEQEEEIKRLAVTSATSASRAAASAVTGIENSILMLKGQISSTARSMLVLNDQIERQHYLAEEWERNRDRNQEIPSWCIVPSPIGRTESSLSYSESVKTATATTTIYKVRAGIANWQHAPDDTPIKVDWCEVSTLGDNLASYSSISNSFSGTISDGAIHVESEIQIISHPEVEGRIVVAGPGDQTPTMRIRFTSKGAGMYKFGFPGYIQGASGIPTIYRRETSTGAHEWSHGHDLDTYYDFALPNEYLLTSSNYSTPSNEFAQITTPESREEYIQEYDLMFFDEKAWLNFTGPGKNTVISETSREIRHDDGSMQYINLSEPWSTDEIVVPVEDFIASTDWTEWWGPRFTPSSSVAMRYLAPDESFFVSSKTKATIESNQPIWKPLVYLGYPASWTTSVSVPRLTIDLTTGEAEEDELTLSLTNLNTEVIEVDPPTGQQMIRIGTEAECSPVAKLHLALPLVSLND